MALVDSVNLYLTHGRESHTVDFGKVEGISKQFRKTFKRRSDALKIVKACNAGNKSMVAQFLALTQERQIELLMANSLMPEGESIVEAVVRAKNTRRIRCELTVDDAVHKWLDYKNEKDAEYARSGVKKKSEDSAVDRKTKTQPFRDTFGERRLEGISFQELTAWFSKLASERNWASATCNGYRRQLVNFFNHWVKIDEKLKMNPAYKIERKIERSTKVIHGPKEVRSMLRATYLLQPTLLPYAVLTYFTGVRPNSEVLSVHPDCIDFEKKTMEIPEAKMGPRDNMMSTRWVELHDNAIVWLKLIFELDLWRSGEFVYFSRDRWSAIKETAGVQWGNDLTRKSYATHHEYVFSNIRKTLDQMGHRGGEKTFQQSYRTTMTPDQKAAAPDYFKILPSNTLVSPSSLKIPGKEEKEEGYCDELVHPYSEKIGAI